METVRSMRRLGRVVAAATLAGVLVGGAAPAAAFHREGVTEAMSLNILAKGPLRGIVLIEANDDEAHIYQVFKGLPTTGKLRAVLSTKPCTKAHTAADRVLGWSLGASNPTSVRASYFAMDLDGVATGWYTTLRIFRGGGTGDQRACTQALHGSEAATAEAYELKNVLVSNLLGAPGPRGLVTVGTPTDGGPIRVRALLLHKDRGTFRLVGSRKPCGQAHTGAAKVFARTYSLGDTATHEVGHWVSVVGPSGDAAEAMRSIRLFKGAGTGRQVECRGIIAVLIGI